MEAAIRAKPRHSIRTGVISALLNVDVKSKILSKMESPWSPRTKTPHRSLQSTSKTATWQCLLPLLSHRSHSAGQGSTKDAWPSSYCMSRTREGDSVGDRERGRERECVCNIAFHCLNVDKVFWEGERKESTKSKSLKVSDHDFSISKRLERGFPSARYGIGVDMEGHILHMKAIREDEVVFSKMPRKASSAVWACYHVFISSTVSLKLDETQVMISSV